MDAEERAFFEQHRKNVPEIDQLVVEHTMFLNQLEDFSANKNLKRTLNDVHSKLLDEAAISEGSVPTSNAKVIFFWNKYKKVTAIAAVVGGAIAFMISGLVAYFAPQNQQYLSQLGAKVEQQERKITALKNEIKTSKIPENVVIKSGGSAFLIDGSGYLVTNAHVVEDATFAVISNDDGKEFKAKVAFKDINRDLAILKIEDEDYSQVKNLPYSFRKNNLDLGEEVYTLGYPNFPRNEVVYNIGYLSGETGYNGDSLSFQIQMNANHGNSGGPVLNKNGEVVGVLSTKQLKADGVTFAIKSKNIYKIVDEIKKKDQDVRIKINNTNSLKGDNRVHQIKNVKDYVYMVKAYTK
jgi:S1-C subfamily serine protease